MSEWVSLFGHHKNRQAKRTQNKIKTNEKTNENIQLEYLITNFAPKYMIKENKIFNK